jgi:photosystem II stability/assembly factor-like uncharacterized protein
MRASLRISLFAALIGIAGWTAVSAQNQDLSFREMRWRDIGPTRSGRARAAAGVASQPNTFYAGFDNGGVWRSTDYGANWVPLFDEQPTGSIGAIGVSPSNPNVIYVGTGAGIIRPDLAIGDGIYKSTDAGKTWTHLGLRDTQMIAAIAVDPTNPDRLFVAALGHPYGPNAERGVFRSIDGGKSFEKVLYKDEYTSANEILMDPKNPNTLYAMLWSQQQSFIEGQGFGNAGMGMFKSTNGGTTWTQLSEGLPTILQANVAISASDSNILYAAVAPGQGPIGFYKSTDGGAHWIQPIKGPGAPAGLAQDMRPLGRIGGGDLPTVTIDPKDPNVVYTASTVMWRTMDGGLTWSAVRGAPGGDDYQRIWINPNNPDIIFAVADQGAVVSANRGTSWSNWYNQNTAAMYHVTTDNAFPYRVCSGQQDSGSACVASRSDDGRITFHDWHPVNIQEYGMAAPDPKNPDIVYGSQRGGVSRYDRKTAQTTQVGPDTSGTLPGGAAMNRNVRTMPLIFSPIDNLTMFYAQNVVWKSIDHGHSWTRISGDLTRGANWTAPANTGKYGASVKPAPMGSITALAPSPKSALTLWSGSDDGAIQVTRDGGATWTNVTPPSIKAWTRVFNMEAGHFDALTAYAAANTLRLDEIKPHFYRTHDGGKTWTEINTGIAGDAVANTIREDPKQPGLLYAGTDTQVWVSFDDGDHWQTLRNNMPAISVRDLQVKDDAKCHCADLIAGTHGRGFWILDDVTPLRQAAAAKAALAKNDAYLFKPVDAVRIRFGVNEPTPWPPELPAGESAPPGALIDYYLPKDAASEVRLEISNAAGKVVRNYSSKDPVFEPDPGKDMAAYDEVCKKTPTAADCGLPLYWPAPRFVVSPKAGMHRFSWDLKFDPVSPEDLVPAGDKEATGAVPGHTYPNYSVPWVPSGNYTVKLTVDGKSMTQPITVHLDPRVTIAPATLLQLNTLSSGLYWEAVAAHQAFTDARALAKTLESRSGAAADAVKKELEVLAPSTVQRNVRQLRRRNEPAVTSLEAASNALQAAALSIQAAEVAPTAVQITAANTARAQAKPVMAQWAAVQAKVKALK